MTNDLTRLDAVKALLAQPCEDGYLRALQYSYKQADDRKLRIASKAWVEQVRASWRQAS